MTDRERWTIYPLLFLALGASIKDKLVRPEVLEFNRIQCAELSVLDAQGRRSVYAGAGGIHARNVRLLNRDEQVVISLGSNAKNQPDLRLYDESNRALVALGTDGTGTAGSVLCYDPATEGYSLLLGNTMHVAGVECRELRVMGGEEGDELRVIIASTEGGTPRIQVYGSPGHCVLAMGSDDSGNGSVVSFDSQGMPHFMITASLRPNAAPGSAPDSGNPSPGTADETPDEQGPGQEAAGDDTGVDRNSADAPPEQGPVDDD